MRNQYKILAEMYSQVVEEPAPAPAPEAPAAPAPEKAPEPDTPTKDVAALLTDLNEILSTDSRDAVSAYSEFLLTLLNSTNNELRSAAAKVLNSQPQNESDGEVIANPHGDFEGGNGF